MLTTCAAEEVWSVLKLLALILIILVVMPWLVSHFAPSAITPICWLTPLWVILAVLSGFTIMAGMIAIGERFHSLEMMENSGLVTPIADPMHTPVSELAKHLRPRANHEAGEVIEITSQDPRIADQPIVKPPSPAEIRTAQVAWVVFIFSMLLLCVPIYTFVLWIVHKL
jgi:hypothetical protein